MMVVICFDIITLSNLRYEIFSLRKNCYYIENWLIMRKQITILHDFFYLSIKIFNANILSYLYKKFSYRTFNLIYFKVTLNEFSGNVYSH